MPFYLYMSLKYQKHTPVRTMWLTLILVTNLFWLFLHSILYFLIFIILFTIFFSDCSSFRCILVSSNFYFLSSSIKSDFYLCMCLFSIFKYKIFLELFFYKINLYPQFYSSLWTYQEDIEYFKCALSISKSYCLFGFVALPFSIKNNLLLFIVNEEQKLLTGFKFLIYYSSTHIFMIYYSCIESLSIIKLLFFIYLQMFYFAFSLYW